MKYILEIIFKINICQFGGNQDNGSLDFSYLVNFILLNPPLTLKMRSRSSNPNKFFRFAK